MKNLGKIVAAAAIIGGISISEAAVVPSSLKIATGGGAVTATKAKTQDEYDYSKFFAVDLQEKLPSIDKLREMYVKNTIYDRRYEFAWNIGHKFDEFFGEVIKTYGSSDKRIKKQGEDELYAMIKNMPKELYPYIGPYLHTVPNMSGKILEMPGIKETKNKFPERISEHVKGIKNLEFLSPFMYFVLMPEIWPDYKDTREYPKEKPIYAKVKYDEKFWQKVRAMVRPEDYYPNREKKGEDIKDKLRTINPSLGTPLSSADVKAFGRTLREINEFSKAPGRMALLSEARILINNHEDATGKGLPVNTLKDLVNPCQRLIQRLRVTRLEGEFMQIVGKEGFSPEEWAYTCDKTIKAYRLSRINWSTVASILNYKQNLYKETIMDMPLIFRGRQVSAMLAIPEMYKASREDVEAVRKNRQMLSEEFKAIDYTIAGAPIDVSP